ncbi:MAG: hypothetical protein ACPGVB_10540 [Chitinophagales bacterium]
MKKILSILSVFAILFSTNIFAQSQADADQTLLSTRVKTYNAADFQINPQQVAQELTTNLNTQLVFNSQQEAAVYQINLETAQKRVALSDLQNTDTDAFIAKVMEVYQARNTAIESVLNTKQKLEFNRLKQSMMSRKVDLH